MKPETLNQLRDTYLETLKVAQRISKALELNQNESETFASAILANAKAKDAYDKALAETPG